MTINASRDLLYVVSSLIVVVRTYQLIRLDWSRPVKHGSGFFLAFEVPPGFYNGVGLAWLARYHALLIAEYAIEWIALAALVLSGHWQWLPVWAGGSAMLCVTALAFFGSIAGRALAGAAPQPAVALSLEARRLGDFLSWPVEGLIVAIVAAGWLLLVAGGDAAVHWGTPAILTYVVLALFVAKIVHIRAGAPLPVDRTDEHQRYFDATRRQAVRVIDSGRWLFVVVFASYAVLHGWRAVDGIAWFRWLLIVGTVAVWLVMVWLIVSGVRRLEVMGRSLRPPASWAGPFRTNPWASRGGGIWAVSFVAGLGLLFAIFGV